MAAGEVGDLSHEINFTRCRTRSSRSKPGAARRFSGNRSHRQPRLGVGPSGLIGRGRRQSRLGDSSKVTFTGCPGVPASYRAETRGRGSAGSSSVSQLAIFERSCGSAQRGHRTWEKRCDDSEEKLPPSISKLVETVSPVAGQTKTRTPISHLPELKTSLSNVLGWSGKNLGSDSSVSRLRPAPFQCLKSYRLQH